MSIDRRDDRCLVFLHIPKTAGQTLHFVALRSFGADERIHLNSLDQPMDAEMEKIPAAVRARARVVWGHLPFGVHRHIPRPCDYVTVLREPISRVVSVYKHILKKDNHELHRQVVGDGMSLEDYVESGIDSGQTENSHTRQLSGRQFGAIESDALAEAKSNLQRFLVVGITERLEESLVLLRRSLGTRFLTYVTRNVSPPLGVSERAIDLIRERNELDAELYAHAQHLLTGQIGAQGWGIRAEARLYRAFRPASRLAGRAADVVRNRAPYISK
jgi:Sulfotransferase family